MSPSARKVWIEIYYNISETKNVKVAFRKEGVDWNIPRLPPSHPSLCRLPQGRCGLKYDCSVGWQLLRRHLPQGRCGLKSPDPNYSPVPCMSPSARKVWIEMLPEDLLEQRVRSSPSARKVWIEIRETSNILGVSPVAFRKEGVDWNPSSIVVNRLLIGRLPQGRCGLKYDNYNARSPRNESPSARKVWIEIFWS